MLTRSRALVALSTLPCLLATSCRTLPAPPPLPPGSLGPAATPEPPPDPDDWQFGVAPYVWAASLDGSMTVKGADRLGMGYRVLDYDVGGSHDVDVTLSGLTVGIGFRF